jgi:hypothetical protein
MGHRILLAAMVLAPLACLGPLRPSEDQLAYSHAVHLTEDLTCLDCHKGIDGADVFEKTFIPTHDGCVKCHDVEKQDECKLCHSEPERARRSETRASGLIFSHKRHMEPAKGNCVRCHEAIPKANTVEETHGPAMVACGGSCHSDLFDDLACDRCHLDLSTYRLEAIRAFAHGQGFERGHGKVARKSASSCAQCHERAFCSDCHTTTRVLSMETTMQDRPTRSFVHPAPYVALHSVDAERRPESCDSCHRPSSCVSCHASYGLAAIRTLDRGPHPSGWLDPVSPKFHGLEARRRITSCAGCHDQGAATNCVRCHQVGGSGGNPHPPGFARRGEIENNRMCRACHWR